MTLSYKGFVAGPIDFDAESRTFSGMVAGLKDVVHFEGTTADELATAFRESIDDYLAMCAERGEQPDKSYSGAFLARIGPDRHRQLALAAAARGQSISAFLGWLVDTAATIPAATNVRDREAPYGKARRLPSGVSSDRPVKLAKAAAPGRQKPIARSGAKKKSKRPA
jgi:predicted HicB family RNase H-like nuclease